MPSYIYYLYKITNLVNNKIYIGVHRQDVSKPDNYMGSGSALKSAIKYFGTENFKKEIIEYFDTEIEMYLKESQIINEDYINNKNNYNIVLGGKGRRVFEIKHLPIAVQKMEKSITRKRNQKLIKEKRIIRAKWKEIKKEHLKENPILKTILTPKCSLKEFEQKFIWITDGVQNKKHFSLLKIPIGFKKGKTKEKLLCKRITIEQYIKEKE